MHIPVLKKEVLDYLNPKPNENFIDCTFGEGGHSAAILEKNGPAGKVLGIEIDNKLYQKAKEKIAESLIQFPNRLILVNDSYVNLEKIAEEHNFKIVNGILLDLGMSSWHLEESKKGFSFMRDEPLDMRYSNKFPISPEEKPSVFYGASNFQFSNLTAEEIVNKWRGEEIEKILKEYGEERFAKKIAKEIAEARQKNHIETTLQLVEIIKKAVPYRYQKGRIHFATKTFQALRIAVNDEMSNLKNVLQKSLKVLSPGGRIVVVSFHSLEDRIAKNFLKNNKEILKIITKKPIRASEKEIKLNRRARSAKLRAAVKK